MEINFSNQLLRVLPGNYKLYNSESIVSFDHTFTVKGEIIPDKKLVSIHFFPLNQKAAYKRTRDILTLMNGVDGF